MQLGPQKWAQAHAYYDRLNFGHDGDLIEQRAESAHGISARLPNLVQFWRYHVCPATRRPNGTTWRPEVADLISVIGQRSHAVLSDLALGLNHATRVRNGDLGLNEENFDIALTFTGNALQKFKELENAICASNPNDFRGMRTLAIQLGRTIDPFPDNDENWQSERARALNYRNYLTHQGRIYRVYRDEVALILSRDAMRSRTVHTWTHADREYDSNPAQWVTLGVACRDVIDDTIAFLDLAYERLRATLDPLVQDPGYQRLWGWQGGQDPIALVVSVPAGPIPPAGTVSMHASSASRTEHTRAVGNQCPPDPSGVRRIS